MKGGGWPPGGDFRLLVPYSLTSVFPGKRVSEICIGLTPLMINNRKDTKEGDVYVDPALHKKGIYTKSIRII